MIERSIEAARTKRICPYCLGNVNPSMICMDCRSDALAWKGEVLPDSAVGTLRRAQAAAEDARQEIVHAQAEPPAFTIPFTVNFHNLDRSPLGPLTPAVDVACAARMVGGEAAWARYKVLSPGSARQFATKVAGLLGKSVHPVGPPPMPGIVEPVKGKRMIDL